MVEIIRLKLRSVKVQRIFKQGWSVGSVGEVKRKWGGDRLAL